MQKIDVAVIRTNKLMDREMTGQKESIDGATDRYTHLASVPVSGRRLSHFSLGLMWCWRVTLECWV